MPLVQTRGAASAQGFGEFAQASAVPNYIEDVFSTYLYTGNSTSQTITNGIDLSTNGGLVWFKNRTAGSTGQMWYDTARGAYNYIQSDSTGAQANGSPDGLSAFTSSGFSVNGASDYWNLSANNYASWTFREQSKFFDIVTYTGNGTTQTISHNLGSAPGCIIVKSTSTASQWNVYHRSLGATQALKLQSTGAASSSVNFWNDTNPTTTQFTVGSSFNTGGETYVAYIFAHDAGGFGLTGTDNVISCGTFTTDGSGNATVTLGYEPQWVLFKVSSTTDAWYLSDNMRGMSQTNYSYLRPNSSAAEGVLSVSGVIPTATGFTINNNVSLNSQTFIYIAIRRGPMKVPTVGTSVFSPVATSGNPSSLTAGFPVDFALGKEVKNSTSYGNYAIDRLRGGSVLLETNTIAAEYTSQTFKFDSNTQFLQSSGGLFYGPSIYWLMRRAPSFFDVVCYTGNGSTNNLTHNLGVVPEFIIIKRRSTATYGWFTFNAVGSNYVNMDLNYDAGSGGSYAISTYANSTQVKVGTGGIDAINPSYNTNAVTFVMYLFATCANVSKCGSYTGTGTTQTINCGFTAGSRFVMIKRTDSTGDWYVWDSARGIVSGNDPYLLLNTTDAEVTSTDYIDTANSGFEISSTAPAAINANGGSFIFFAVA